MFSDHHVVFDSHTKTPESLWTRAVVLADVQSWVKGARDESLEGLEYYFDQHANAQRVLQCIEDTGLWFISVIIHMQVQFSKHLFLGLKVKSKTTSL